MVLHLIIIAFASALLLRAGYKYWRQGKFKERALVKRGHTVFFFDPYELIMYKVGEFNSRTYKDMKKQKIKKNQVAIIALNHKNAERKARKLLIKGGYGRQEAQNVIIKKESLL